MKNLIQKTEKDLNRILHEDLPPCTKTFTELINKPTKIKEDNFYHAFKLFWSSELTQFDKCDDGFNCIFKEGKNKQFLVHNIKNIFAAAKNDTNPLSCYDETSGECKNAVGNIAQEKFTNKEYQKQADTIGTAVQGVTDELRKRYASWATANEECFHELLAHCSGKMQ